MNTLHNIRAFLASTGLFACLLPVGLWAAPPDILPIDTNPVTTAEYRVVGVTTTTTKGAVVVQDTPEHNIIGYAAMNKLCHDQVDVNARLATATEWATARDGTVLSAGPAWLDPGNITLFYRPDASTPDVAWGAIVPYAESSMDYFSPIPRFAIANRSCFDFENGDNTALGTAGLANGTVILDTCDQELPIACAALVAVPIKQ